MGNKEIKISEILQHFYSIKFERVPDVVFLFDKNMSYEEYMQDKILLQKHVSYNLDKLPVEFIF
jgi:hemoglobin-like flavoprotein